MVSRIIEFAARNRFFVLLGVTFVTIGAVWSIRHARIDAIPDLTDPQVIVYTDWAGRSPNLVEDQVTYPISSTLLAAPKVQAVRGFSFLGSSFIYVIFEEGTDIYWARSRVLEYIQSVRNKLPADVNILIIYLNLCIVGPGLIAHNAFWLRWPLTLPTPPGTPPPNQAA